MSTHRSVGFVGGAAVPHAPQFFTLPDTEDHDQVARVEQAMQQIGKELRALEPDVVVILANDHLENFLLHCVPSFTLHCGPEVAGTFAGRDFRWPVASDHALATVRALQDQDFDPAFSLTASIGYEFGIPLTFLGFNDATPLLPVYVNTYAAPQPRAERCYAFGQSLHRALAVQGLRGVIIASGGLSHYPGTEQYASPDVDFDQGLTARVREGNLKALAAYDDHALDATGNVELRSWQILAGALGERAPQHFAFEPSWHHTYAVFGWTSAEPEERTPLHYPPVDPALVALTDALYRLRLHASDRDWYLAEPEEYARDFDLTDEERHALGSLDEEELRGLGVHPLLAFLARLQVDLHRNQTKES